MYTLNVVWHRQWYLCLTSRKRNLMKQGLMFSHILSVGNLFWRVFLQSPRGGTRARLGVGMLNKRKAFVCITTGHRRNSSQEVCKRRGKEKGQRDLQESPPIHWTPLETPSPPLSLRETQVQCLSGYIASPNEIRFLWLNGKGRQVEIRFERADSLPPNANFIF